MKQIDLRRIDLNLLVVFDVLMAELSVTRAAARLGRTQSAVSHSLARLRDQLDDPLLVRAGGRMVPSPFAESLGQEIGAILSGIRRVLTPARAFDPCSTTRTFRLAIPDVSDAIFPMLTERVRNAAPRATIEWMTRDDRVLNGLLDGQLDLALVPAVQPLPEGVAHQPCSPFRWASFVRRDHPALARWSRAEWLRWPHVAVRVGTPVPSPVDAADGRARRERRVVAWVPTFAAVAPLLARTDLIATLPSVVMVGRLERYGLTAMRAPIRIDSMPHRVAWSARMQGDPALRWFRDHFVAVLGTVLAAADAATPR